MHSPSQSNPACAIAVRGLDQFYGETPVLRGIDFRLDGGKTLALLGPSGCGKTTLLRLIAGLLAPGRGSISIDGEVMADAATGAFVPPERRGLGMVFQDYALWPHMSVAENVGFPLEMRGMRKQERQRRVIEALARVSLEGLAGRRPGDLSGGQQQRVAIARAIVAEPRIVLFDEPLSNLDRELRESLVGEIARLVSSLGLTAVYVTHDHSEAFTLADDVAVMKDGEIVQLASPQTLVEAPASLAVAEFLKLGASADAVWLDGLWRLAGTGISIPGPSDVPAFAQDAGHVRTQGLASGLPGRGQHERNRYAGTVPRRLLCAVDRARRHCTACHGAGDERDALPRGRQNWARRRAPRSSLVCSGGK